MCDVCRDESQWSNKLHYWFDQQSVEVLRYVTSMTPHLQLMATCAASTSYGAWKRTHWVSKSRGLNSPVKTALWLKPLRQHVGPQLHFHPNAFREGLIIATVMEPNDTSVPHLTLRRTNVVNKVISKLLLCSHLREEYADTLRSPEYDRLTDKLMQTNLQISKFRLH